MSRRLRGTEGDLEELQTLQAAGSSAAVVGAAGSASLVQPRTKRNVILGVIVGLALGIALAFIREALDTRVRSADELPSAAWECRCSVRFPSPTAAVRTPDSWPH